MATLRHLPSMASAFLLAAAMLLRPDVAQATWITSADDVAAYEEVTDTQTPAERQIAIGRVLWQAGQVAKAEKLFLDARRQAQTLADKVRATDILAEFYQACGENAKAIRVFDSLLSEAAAQHDTTTLIHVYDGVGRAYDSGRQYVKAIKSYRQAEAMLRQRPDSLAEASVCAGMARTLHVAGDVLEAKRLIMKARGLLRPDNLSAMAAVLDTEAKIEATLGEYQTAYETMASSATLTSQLRESEMKQMLNSSNPIYASQSEETRTQFAKEVDSLRAVADENDAARRMAFMASFVLCLLLALALTSFAIVIRRLQMYRRKELEMEQMVKDSDRVMHIVAHDATNQFNTLLGFAEVLVERTRKRGGEEEIFCRHIYTSAQLLFQMTSNLLTWSKTKSQLKPKQDTVTVCECLQGVLESATLVADEKEITIRNTISDDVSVYVDPSHLVIIVRNLLSNAIKFTHHGGTVTLSSATYGDKATIVVEDDGVGMPPEAVSLFNRGQQLRTTDGTDNEKGNGIGLTICRDLARSNRGDIIVEPGRKRGTSVTVVLMARPGKKDKNDKN